MIGNTPEHLTLLNHIMTGTCCNGMAARYCPEGRRLWIDDQAAFIAGLETRAERIYWLRIVTEQNPEYAQTVESRVFEIYQALRVDHGRKNKRGANAA